MQLPISKMLLHFKKAGSVNSFNLPSVSQSFGVRSTFESTSALDMSKISKVKAREILDSRGNPTVEVSIR